MSRSSKEPSMMVIDDFCFFNETNGAFKGYKAVVLKANHAGQKGKAITLNNHTATEFEHDVHYFPIYQMEIDNPMDEYNLIEHYFQKMLPADSKLEGTTRIFRYKASRKDITAWSAKGLTWQASTKNCWGSNHFNEVSKKLPL